MKIKEHGRWTTHNPTPKMLADKPWLDRAVCARGEKGEDWYEYNKKLKGGVVYATVYKIGGDLIIGTARFDAEFLFPGNAMLIEIEGYTGNNLEKDFWGKLYDPKTKTIKDPPPPPKMPDPREMAKEIEELKAMVATLLKSKK